MVTAREDLSCFTFPCPQKDKVKEYICIKKNTLHLLRIYAKRSSLSISS